MKIREISAMLCLCLLMHPVSAAAEEPEVTKEPEATPLPTVTEAPQEETEPYRKLLIDNENRYEHMDRAYQDGDGGCGQDSAAAYVRKQGER